MPITINLMPPLNGIGPGLRVVAQSNFVGPFPEGTFWEFNVVTQPETNNVVDGETRTWVSNAVDFIWASEPLLSRVGTSAAVPAGTTVWLEVKIQTPSGVADSGTLQTTWQPTTNLGQQAKEIARLQGEGTFTTEDRATIQATEQATIVDIPSLITPPLRIAIGLTELVGAVPTTRLVPSECAAYTGRGELTRSLLGLPVAAFGIAWTVLTVPPGWGSRDGAVEEYFERACQIVVVNHDNAGAEFVDQIIDVTAQNGRFAWSWNNLPSRLLYDVTPGCEVEFCWLLL